jgi:hypothetical protein
VVEVVVLAVLLLLLSLLGLVRGITVSASLL